ncbi:hypothetical protein ACFLXN_03115, partial [Chloroflexota bacterium]
MNEKTDLEDKQTDTIEDHAQEEAEYTKTLHKKYLGIRKRYWVIGLLVLAVVITITLVVYRDTFATSEEEPLGIFASLGPLGLFLLCLASNATIILPVGSV